MPVRAHHLHRNAVITADPGAEGLDEQHDQRDHPRQHVQGMQTRDHIQELPLPRYSMRTPSRQQHKKQAQYRR